MQFQNFTQVLSNVPKHGQTLKQCLEDGSKREYFDTLKIITDLKGSLPNNLICLILILMGPSYTDKLLEFRCAPLVADLFLYCYERDFMDSLNQDNQADVIEALNSTSRYLDDFLNNDNPYFEGMVNQIYSPNYS